MKCVNCDTAISSREKLRNGNLCDECSVKFRRLEGDANMGGKEEAEQFIGEISTIKKTLVSLQSNLTERTTDMNRNMAAFIEKVDAAKMTVGELRKSVDEVKIQTSNDRRISEEISSRFKKNMDAIDQTIIALKKHADKQNEIIEGFSRGIEDIRQRLLKGEKDLQETIANEAKMVVDRFSKIDEMVISRAEGLGSAIEESHKELMKASREIKDLGDAVAADVMTSNDKADKTHDLIKKSDGKTKNSFQDLTGILKQNKNELSSEMEQAKIDIKTILGDELVRIDRRLLLGNRWIVSLLVTLVLGLTVVALKLFGFIG